MKVRPLFCTLAIVVLLAGNAFAQNASGSLPFVLATFNASLTNSNTVAVSWTVQQQVNTDCFDVEKSNDGASWRSIATLKAAGNAAIPITYNALDIAPLKGTNFYRIRVKDLGGNIGYTMIKNVRMNAPGKINLYPNPSSGIVSVCLGEVPRDDWSMIIINNMGKVMAQEKYSKNITIARLSVNNYPAGNYTVEIINGNSRQRNKLMINHN